MDLAEQLAENKELKGMMRFTVNPGEVSGVIKREDKEFLVAIPIDGCGTIRPPERKLGWSLSGHGCPRLDFREGKEFVISVLDTMKQPCTVIILRFVWGVAA